MVQKPPRGKKTEGYPSLEENLPKCSIYLKSLSAVVP
jgi:hypothetical protein